MCYRVGVVSLPGIENGVSDRVVHVLGIVAHISYTSNDNRTNQRRDKPIFYCG